MRKAFVIIVALFCCLCLGAQQRLTLSQAVEMAQNGSYEAEISDADYQAGMWQFSSFMSTFKPHLEFNINPNYIKEAYEPTNQFVRTRDYNMFSTAAELRLNQKIAAFGGDFYAANLVSGSQPNSL